MITASVFVSCSNDDDPADFSDENIQHGPICGLLIGRFGGFAPSECNYGIISYILVRDFITLLPKLLLSYAKGIMLQEIVS